MSSGRISGFLALLLCLGGCAVNEKTYWAVTDAETYWSRPGFAVQAPSSSHWFKAPSDENYPDSIVFVRGEGANLGGVTDKPVYVNSATVLACGSVLDEPVVERNDKQALAAALRRHLDRYQGYWTTKITDAGYDGSLGVDCLRYAGIPKKENHAILGGSVKELPVKGYFCLHPENNQFAVMMESRDYSTSGTKIPFVEEQADHFFRSLRFAPISTAVTRTFKATTFPTGRSPYSLAFLQRKVWIVLKDEGRVDQLDPAEGKTISSVAVGKEPVAVCVGDRSLWVANGGDGTVTRIDPVTARVVQTIAVGGKPAAITFDSGFLWVADAVGNVVIKIDAAANAVAARIPVGREPLAVREGKDGIWTANAGDGTVSVIDKVGNAVSATLKVGTRPVQLSMTKKKVWVADEGGRAVVQIDRQVKKVANRFEVKGAPASVRASDNGEIFVALPDLRSIVTLDAVSGRTLGQPIAGVISPRSLIDSAGAVWFVDSSRNTLTVLSLNPFGR
ncbi:hypothetical protein [Geomonas sp.]|uniref:YncE family protein n=1 Tax=Geomonas sp. TaxID=2651584 RepID=UPI002B473219|nr:hypothetical protein [Geomonas sp.]HJV34743.1 hypothetical protein [Geomonas sp.]